MAWSPVRQGCLAAGDNNKRIYVWEPAEAGKWQVSNSWQMVEVLACAVPGRILWGPR